MSTDISLYSPRLKGHPYFFQGNIYLIMSILLELIALLLSSRKPYLTSQVGLPFLLSPHLLTLDGCIALKGRQDESRWF